MRVLSLHQPWATLMKIGAKHVETRSWPTNYRGPLAIHAAKKILPDFGQICHREPFRSVLEAAGYDEMECFEFGKIVCVVTLAECCHTDMVERFDTPELFGRHEKEFGDYMPGRFAWITHNHRSLFPESLPFKGGQGIRNLPPDVEVEVRRRMR